MCVCQERVLKRLALPSFTSTGACAHTQACVGGAKTEACDVRPNSQVRNFGESQERGPRSLTYSESFVSVVTKSTV